MERLCIGCPLTRMEDLYETLGGQLVVHTLRRARPPHTHRRARTFATHRLCGGVHHRRLPGGPSPGGGVRVGVTAATRSTEAADGGDGPPGGGVGPGLDPDGHTALSAHVFRVRGRGIGSHTPGRLLRPRGAPGSKTMVDGADPRERRRRPGRRRPFLEDAPTGPLVSLRSGFLFFFLGGPTPHTVNGFVPDKRKKSQPHRMGQIPSAQDDDYSERTVQNRRGSHMGTHAWSRIRDANGPCWTSSKR